jgi:hypothetical protein
MTPMMLMVGMLHGRDRQCSAVDAPRLRDEVRPFASAVKISTRGPSAVLSELAGGPCSL